MSIARSLLVGGPAYVNFNSVNFHLSDDSKLELLPATSVLASAQAGDFDESYTDLLVRGTGTPLTYDNLATLWPYLAPTIGQRIFGSSDVPFTWWSNNGDKVVVRAGAVTKMPDLTLGVEGPAVGPIELTGVIGTGLDVETANSYYTISNSAATFPAITERKIPRQKYTAAWGAFGLGFDSMQAQDKWTISHELKLAPVKIQGRTVDMKVVSYRAMAKCHPTEPTMAQIDVALGMQGSLKHGARLSTGTSAADLVITGQNTVSVTVKKAAMKGAGFVFGGKELRNGEVGWVSTIDISSGAPTAALVLGA